MLNQNRSDPYGALREQSRQHFYNLWQLAKVGHAPTEGEDALLVQVMREHPEYYDTWAHAIEFGQELIPAGGVDPFMHALIHSVVENQIAQNNPPETRAVVEYKTSRNIPRHDVIHEIGNEVAKVIWTVLRDNKPADNNAYRRRLVRLLPRAQRNLPK
jgi:hypothetical protein